MTYIIIVEFDWIGLTSIYWIIDQHKTSENLHAWTLLSDFIRLLTTLLSILLDEEISYSTNLEILISNMEQHFKQDLFISI